MTAILPGPNESLLLTCECSQPAYYDEVVDAWYCEHLAGPLAWDDGDILASELSWEMRVSYHWERE